jgi:gliding motility-associated lipoprotein GldK
MRKIYFLGFFIICGLLYGYKNGNKVSFLASNYGKPSPIIPQGMVLIPQGKALIGMTDEDLTFYQGNPSVMTSFSAFYMDQTETTNAQYRKFVNWVRDSIAISSMGQSGAPALYNIPNPNAGNSRLSGPQNIDWRKIDKNSAVLWGSNSQYKSKLQNMYYSGKDALPGKNEIDVRRLKYSYSYLSLDLAAAGANDPSKKRQDFIVSYTDNPTPGSSNEFPSVSVYPDTTVWKKDFPYSQNDPMVKTYFNHPSYDNYPVVGVNWEQANAFCNWRTLEDNRRDAYRKGRPLSKSEYRLPTDQEFEYAARGGRTQTKYPWVGSYITGPCKTNVEGCLLANFKVGRGNYADDNGMYTVKVKSYLPNDYGLFDMAGNVAEWTSTAYNRSSTSLLLDFNPDYINISKGNKVVRGGSWKDIGFFLQNSVSTYEQQDKPRSYIGFRCVSTLVGSN